MPSLDQLLSIMADPQFYFVYKGMYVPSYFYTPESLKYWEEFTFRPDDIIIATYQKSGTIWALEIVPLIMSGGDPSVVDTVPTWERSTAVGHRGASGLHLDKWPSPRIFATHFHYSAMPPSFFQVKPKVINIMRNPKDVLISAFYYYGAVEYHADPGRLKDFLLKFLDGHVSFNSWFDHVKSWLGVEDRTHILYLTFEEMVEDLQQGVQKMAEFLEKPLEAEVIDKITERCLFKNMKKNTPTSKESDLKDRRPVVLFRKGISGDWRNHLSEEEARHFDTVYKEKMKDVDFKFLWD